MMRADLDLRTATLNSTTSTLTGIKQHLFTHEALIKNNLKSSHDFNGYSSIGIKI